MLWSVYFTVPKSDLEELKIQEHQHWHPVRDALKKSYYYLNPNSQAILVCLLIIAGVSLKLLLVQMWHCINLESMGLW